MDNSYITISMCNFNTTEITSNALRSIIKHIKNIKYKIILLDNSDKIPYKIPSDLIGKIIVLDNTNGKYINFKHILKTIKYKTTSTLNNFGSLKHTFSIQFLINICQTSGLLIFDSDIIVKKDLYDLIDYKYATVADIIEYGEFHNNSNIKYDSPTRFLPYIQFFNLNYNIQYFNLNKCRGISIKNFKNEFKSNTYDTGASYYEFIIKNKYPYKQINYFDYIIHFEHGSWLNSIHKYIKKDQ